MTAREMALVLPENWWELFEVFGCDLEEVERIVKTVYSEEIDYGVLPIDADEMENYLVHGVCLLVNYQSIYPKEPQESLAREEKDKVEKMGRGDTGRDSKRERERSRSPRRRDSREKERRRERSRSREKRRSDSRDRSRRKRSRSPGRSKRRRSRSRDRRRD
jgi:hypothetical protein